MGATRCRLRCLDEVFAIYASPTARPDVGAVLFLFFYSRGGSTAKTSSDYSKRNPPAINHNFNLG